MNLGIYCIVNIWGIKYVNKVLHNKQHNDYGKLLFVSKRNEPSCNALFIMIMFLYQCNFFWVLGIVYC